MTVSKTTLDRFLEYGGLSNIKEDCDFSADEVCEFADSLTAELQKENARLDDLLTEALEWLPSPSMVEPGHKEEFRAFRDTILAALSKEKE